MAEERKKASQAKLNYMARYDQENTKQIRLKLNTKTDVDILEKLESVDNKQGYIKGLIRADIAKESQTD